MEKKKKNPEADQEQKVFGDPVYSADQDIFSRAKKESVEDEDESALSSGLDVPGSELDDADEVIGEEDEENNYYSLGGDDHSDLEENKDE